VRQARQEPPEKFRVKSFFGRGKRGIDVELSSEARKAVFRCTVSCSPFVSNTPSAPTRIFSVECCIAGSVLAERSVPDAAAVFHTLYREQKRRKRVLGWRRTHRDPFAGEWEQIMSWLAANPERSSGDIFRELQRRSPGRYQRSQIRTLQRGMRKIRAHLLETFEEQWQEEVIRGPSSAPVLPAEETVSISLLTRSE
jgi:hypothetical protein